MAVLLSLHELDLARKISDKVVCVSPEAVSGVLTPEEAFTKENICRIYHLTAEEYTFLYGPDAAVQTPAPQAEPPKKPRPKFEHYVRSGQKLLRCGYTTGTCAALGAAGAARLLLTGRTPETVALRTPKGIVVEVAPLACHPTEDGAVCVIEKDGGDDADVTTGLPVAAEVVLKPERADVQKEAESAGYAGGFAVTVSIEGGAEVAKRTFNPHIGVEGGLSVLGTSGIVEPMSEQALLDTIQLEMNQARLRPHPGTPQRLILAPGNYGLDYLHGTLPQLEKIPVVKCSNFIGDTLDMAAAAGFEEVLLIGHVGKLCKLAGGIMNTHSHTADCRTELFCTYAALSGAGQEVCAALLHAATTDACIEILDKAGLRAPVLAGLVDAIQTHLDRRAAGAFRVGAILFSNQHGPLGQTQTAKELLQAWTM